MDSATEKSVLRSPCGMCILRNLLAGIERERSRGRQAHHKPTDDGPSGAQCTRLSCSRNVSCDRGFERLQIQGKRSIHHGLRLQQYNNFTLLKSSADTHRKSALAFSNPWLELSARHQKRKVRPLLQPHTTCERTFHTPDSLPKRSFSSR